MGNPSDIDPFNFATTTTMITDAYNPPISSYPSPLAGYEGLPPLSDDKNADGKSLKNEPAAKSAAYDEFVEPLDKGIRGGLYVFCLSRACIQI